MVPAHLICYSSTHYFAEVTPAFAAFDFSLQQRCARMTVKKLSLPFVKYSLRLFKGHFIDDRWMRFLRIKPFLLSSVYHFTVRQVICPIGLLPDRVSGVFFVSQNSDNSAVCPAISPLHLSKFFLLHVQCCSNIAAVLSVEKFFKYYTDVFCLFLINKNVSRLVFSIAKWYCSRCKSPLLHTPLYAPARSS